MKGYLQALRHYAVFRGRATRTEFWGFVMCQILAILVLSFLERQFAIANPEIYMGKITALYMLATLLPAFAVTARRLRDSGVSGWWTLLLIVPVLGWCLVLGLSARASTSDISASTIEAQSA